MNPAHQPAVEALTRHVVAEVAPAELPLLRAAVADYRADPARALSGRPRTDEPLGFGAEAAVVLVAPFALDLVTRLFDRLSERLGDAAADGIALRVLSLFGRRDVGPAPEPRQPEVLTPQQLALVAETTRAEADGLALPRDQAERLADAVVAALATRT